MQDPISVISAAAKGHVHDLAQEFEVSDSRMYEILSTNNPYPRTKRLIRAIFRVNPEGARLIRADLDAMFGQMFGDGAEVNIADIHREFAEALQAMLTGAPRADQLRELREAHALIQSAIERIDAGEVVK